VSEGDTVLRAARRLDAALAGEVVAVTTPNPRGRAAGVERLDGHRLERVQAHGKNLLLDFGELVLHSHLGMSGSWHVYRVGEPWRKAPGAAWAVLGGESSEAVQFGGTTLRLTSPAAARRELVRLGPDILAPDLNLGEAATSLRRAGERPLGEALLDQALIAGIGNIFKSEASFAARLDPWRRVADLSTEELTEVLSTARRQMQESVESGWPSTAVYRRAGRPCPVCGTPIVSRGQGDANRTTYWCPTCQAR
jgi:endonuclease-8